MKGPPMCQRLSGTEIWNHRMNHVTSMQSCWGLSLSENENASADSSFKGKTYTETFDRVCLQRTQAISIVEQTRIFKNLSTTHSADGYTEQEGLHYVNKTVLVMTERAFYGKMTYEWITLLKFAESWNWTTEAKRGLVESLKLKANKKHNEFQREKCSGRKKKSPCISKRKIFTKKVVIWKL